LRRPRGSNKNRKTAFEKSEQAADKTNTFIGKGSVLRGEHRMPAKKQDTKERILSACSACGWGVIGAAIGMRIDLVIRGAIFLARLRSQKWTRFQLV